jgi:phosphatidylglycerol:prolipoprotein diacylglycerol transferase
MHPILIDFGSFQLYTYGLFVALGFICAVFVSQKIAAPYNIKHETISDVFLIILVSALIGARGLYIIINFDGYKNNLLDIFKLWNGGLVFFGGFISAVIATAVFFRVKKMNVWLMADIISPGIALGHAVGRVGCLFAGCCYGKTCQLPFAISFHDPQSLAPLNIDLHPTQIYMIVSNLVLFFILLWLGRNKQFNGIIFLTYIVLYSLFRFIIEFFRGDDRGYFIFEYISLSQGIGLLVSILAFVFILILFKKNNERHHLP